MSRMDIPTPIGYLRLSEDNGVIHESRLVSEPEQEEFPSALLLEAKLQVEAYFCGHLRAFDLPYEAHGTPFEEAVWNQLQTVPYGCVRTYGEIAKALGNPGAYRAIGRACSKNPLLLLIPCHRIIGSKGSLTGFAAGLERKKALLVLEGAIKEE